MTNKKKEQEMDNWISYLIGTGLALGLADFCTKLAAGKISNGLGFLIFGICTFTISSVWFLWQSFHRVDHLVTSSGVVAGTAAGICFSLVTLGLYASFASGAPITIASPVIRILGLLIASLLGLTVLQEPISWRYLLGVLLAASGILLIITR